MRKIFLMCVLIAAAAICASAQNKPFSSIDDFLEKNGGDFNNREEIVKLFNQERTRLGRNFEKELWKYLGKDVDKHYWISSFVEWEGYLQGNPPLPELSFKIKKRGVKLIGETDDKSKLGAKITFLRDLAVASYRAGKQKQALKYKSQAASLYEKFDDIGAYIGATTEFEKCIYDNLEKDPRICKEN
jgi:hypothetical protein